jgi:hypothetical protein
MTGIRIDQRAIALGLGLTFVHSDRRLQREILHMWKADPQTQARLNEPVFGRGRFACWTAHVLEQYRNNRLIRPRVEYKGNPDGQPWIPIENR